MASLFVVLLREPQLQELTVHLRIYWMAFGNQLIGDIDDIDDSLMKRNFH